jgi:hypothetical protein
MTAEPLRPGTHAPTPEGTAAGGFSGRGRAAIGWGLGCAALLLTLGGFVVGAVYLSGRASPESTQAPRGGPLCQALAECCRQVMAHHQGDAQLVRRCDNFLHMPESGCMQQREAYHKSAVAVGLACQ